MIICALHDEEGHHSFPWRCGEVGNMDCHDQQRGAPAPGEVLQGHAVPCIQWPRDCRRSSIRMGAAMPWGGRGRDASISGDSACSSWVPDREMCCLYWCLLTRKRTRKDSATEVGSAKPAAESVLLVLPCALVIV